VIRLKKMKYMKCGNSHFTYKNLAPLSTDTKLCLFITADLPGQFSTGISGVFFLLIIFLLLSVMLDRTEIKRTHIQL